MTRQQAHVNQKREFFPPPCYLQSLCPVPADGYRRADAAPFAGRGRRTSLSSGCDPGAVLLTPFALWIAARAVRRVEISYRAEV